MTVYLLSKDFFQLSFLHICLTDEAFYKYFLMGRSTCRLNSSDSINLIFRGLLHLFDAVIIVAGVWKSPKLRPASKQLNFVKQSVCY